MTSIVERAPEWIRFLPANAWGRRLIHPMAPERLNDPETTVHHTSGHRRELWSAEEAMRDLQTWSHRQGYATVAYDAVQHFHHSGLVTIMEGRGAARSAATRDRNEKTEAYCLMGNFHPGTSYSIRPNARELEAAAWGIAWMIELGWSAIDTVINGHRDNPAHPGASECPGDDLYVHLPWLRNRVAQILNPTPPSVVTPPNPEEDAVLVNYVKIEGRPHVYKQWSNGTKTHINTGALNLDAFLSGRDPDDLRDTIVTLPVDDVFDGAVASGPIVGPIPDGVDAWGRPK